MEENKTAAGSEHSLSIENTKRISATGIEGVQGFSPTQFTLIYAGGKIVVGGSDTAVRVTPEPQRGGQRSSADCEAWRSRLRDGQDTP